MDSRFKVLCCFLLLLASCNATPKTIRVRCKSGEFLKQYPLFSCGRCDENCAIGKCLDIEGCAECDSGYYLSREDDIYPKKCVPCKIEGCAECKDNVYDKDGAICVVAAEGFKVAHEGTNCVKIEEPAPVPVVKSEPLDEQVVVASSSEKTTPVVTEPTTEEYEATPTAVAASTEEKPSIPTPSPVGRKKVEPNSASAKASVSKVFAAEAKPATGAVASSAATKKEEEKPYKAAPSPVEKKEEKPYEASPVPATKEEVKVPVTSTDPVVTETPVVETPVVETPVVKETPVVETPVVETPVVKETPVVETPVVETPVVTETPVVETPVGSTAGESFARPTTTEPVVEEKESIVCAYPEGCEDGYFFNIKTCKCEACDVYCVLGNCENDKGCTLCKPGYIVVRTESAEPGKCVKCTIPYCKLCSAGIFGLSPVQCVECEQGYKLSNDKKSCTKIQPVVVNKSLKCPLGQFYKTEGKMCVDCDAYCKPGYCEDDKGCMKCKPGYYTSREDAFWPRKCLPCDIKNCAECTDNVYDHFKKTCAKCEKGYKPCHGYTACEAY